ncbi:MAG: FG-GAP-like repeat-containing protein, partial [Bacteroidota bacterium]
FTESLKRLIGHTSLFSMGSDIADINNDGFTDIITLDMLPEGNYRQKMVSGPDNYEKFSLLEKSGFYHQTMRNMLHLNNMGKSFSEIGQFSGVSNTDWSWASLVSDFDNDGNKDIFITNGYKRDYTNMDFMNFAVQEKLNENNTGKRTAITELLEQMPSTIVENYAFRNRGDLTFEKMNSKWGVDQKSLSNGAAYADLDNDGDLDLVVNNIESGAFIYRNNSEKLSSNNFIKIKLLGESKNKFGIGAKITLQINDNILVQELIPSRGYQSAVAPNLVFGLGNAKVVKELKVQWPNAEVQVLTNIKPNQTIQLQQKDASFIKSKEKLPVQSYFTDVTKDGLIQYHHLENNFNDFRREQLLPHQLSTQGPKVSAGDVNSDGKTDLFIGGAKGKPGKLFVQTPSQTFMSTNLSVLEKDKDAEDMESLFFDADNDQDLDLYVVSGGADFEKDSPDLVDRLYLNDGKGNFSRSNNAIPNRVSSGSCVTTGDFDLDGDLDLFVGGRLVPGRYPEAARSYILQNDGKGNFKEVTEDLNPKLKRIGLVTDALWTDFNGDKAPDLLVVGEFMGIRVFENKNGKLTEISEESGLRQSQGWWNTLKEGDFDNDGDTDFVIGNFGWNSQLKASREEPVSLYAKDFDANGSIDPILCSFIQGESYPIFSKDDLLGQLNGLKRKYVNYADYAGQRISDILSPEELKEVKVLNANNFATSYVENLGNNQFKITSLPSEAQFSPVYGILTRDFDEDGNLDLLLGGNFFGTRVKYGRYDANKGLLLLGDGKGGFKPVDGLKSGLQMDGEVRDIIFFKVGTNEKVLVAKNNLPVQVFRINPDIRVEK